MKVSIKAKWLVRLGGDADILVKTGEKVVEGQELVKEGREIIKSYDASIVLSRLPKNQIENLVEKWKEKDVVINDLLLDTGGLMSKKLFCPDTGIFLEIDEFYNLKIRIDEGKKHVVYSPVDAIVGKIDKEKLVLEFEAVEMKGKEIISGKCWGDSNLAIIDNLIDLDWRYENRIILSKNMEKSFLMKAEVIGISGIIIKDDMEIKYDSIESAIPILAINENDWSKLVELKEKVDNVRMLLNAKMGRLLLVKK